MLGRLRIVGLLLSAALSLSSAAAAQGAPTVPTVPPAQVQRKVLREGALGIAGAALVTGIFAATAATIASGHCNVYGDHSAELCLGHSQPATAAAVTAILTFEVFGPLAIGSGILRASNRHGRRANSALVYGLSYGSLTAMTAMSLWATDRVADQGARVIAPVATLLTLVSIATPLAFGFLAYRLSEVPVLQAKVVPIASRDHFGALLNVRF
ncbi:MAG: hypothetical protein JWN04_5824 [Myxococcaceae bacterium]|nr:hypothetical protein [Myxococcaceae bacterium]